MRLSFSKKFIRDYRKLSQQIQKTVDKQLELLLSDPQHPSLRIKRMEGVSDIWEGRITHSYRFTFQVEGDIP